MSVTHGDRAMNETTDTAQNAEALLVATFALGDALFGFDARKIQEVVKAGDITPVHHAPPYVVGIRNLRGKIITILDLAVRLELGSVEPDSETRILIIEWHDESMGLLVDRMADTIETERRSIENAPPNLHGVSGRHLLGVCRSGGRLVGLLDPDSVLKPEEQAVAGAAKEATAS
jgi:purine-binding chemotaxis protein CheW